MGEKCRAALPGLFLRAKPCGLRGIVDILYEAVQGGRVTRSEFQEVAGWIRDLEAEIKRGEVRKARSEVPWALRLNT